MKFGNTFLQDGWHICPVCGKIYHEREGCENGCVPALQIVEDTITTMRHFEHENEIDIELVLDYISSHPHLLKKLNEVMDLSELETILQNQPAFETCLQLSKLFA